MFCFILGIGFLFGLLIAPFAEAYGCPQWPTPGLISLPIPILRGKNIIINLDINKPGIREKALNGAILSGPEFRFA